MEEQPQVEDVQTVSHAHENGEFFTASNIEAARGMCPVLGKMSLEEAGLLLELEAMGREQIAGEQKASLEKSVIEKAERVGSERDLKKSMSTVNEAVPEIEAQVRKTTEPTVEEISAHIARTPIDPDLHAVHMQQLETVPSVDDGSEAAEEVRPTTVARRAPVEKTQPAPKDKKIDSYVDTEAGEASKFHDARPDIGELAPVASEYIIHQLDKSPPEQYTDAIVINEGQAVKQEPLPVIEMAKTDDAPVESILFKDLEVISAEATELIETEAFKPKKHITDYSLFENDEAVSLFNGLNQTILEHSDGEEALPDFNDAVQLVEDKSVDTIEVESPPMIAISELSSPIVEIEITMTKLIEVLEIEEAEEHNKVGAILEEIITLPIKPEVAATEDLEGLEEKLGELFVGLFDETDIKYTSELIESFVKLTKAHYLEEMLAITQDVKNENEDQDQPAEIGTREFLQKLRHGLSAMKQVVINFYEIGKSIMRLYAYSFEPSLSFRVT